MQAQGRTLRPRHRGRLNEGVEHEVILIECPKGSACCRACRIEGIDSIAGGHWTVEFRRPDWSEDDDV
jgi:hypothetical protein